MKDKLSLAAEERFGIKADPDAVEKLYSYILDSYGKLDPDTIGRVFSSGEAADFLTVNETYFFREPAHFSFLLDLLPSFTKNSPGEIPPGKTALQICCAAVSSGCEAYSIAMLIEAYNRSAETRLPYQIDAFDINPRVIETAGQGIYGARTLREDGSVFHYMAEPYLKKTGGAPGAQARRYRLDPSLKKNIRFFVHNLMDALPPKEYDLVFFRNAFIYFLPRYRDRILSNLAAVLREGGILIMGVSETASVHHAGIEEKNRGDVFYFQKSPFTEIG